MENVLKYQKLSYDNVIDSEGFTCFQGQIYLECDGINNAVSHKLFISVITIQIFELLKMILPLLKESGTPFLLIKNDKLHYKLNAGDFGVDNIGKVMVIYPKTPLEALKLAQQINLVTQSFDGPLCSSAIRVGKILYAEDSKIAKTIKFPVDRQYKKKKKHPVIVGKYYVPIAIIKTSFKGTIYKAVSIKKLSFKTCLIKEGKPVALDDHLGRSIKDRLLWQKQVTLDLQDHVATPAYCDYFEENEHSYLVIQFIAGVTLFEKVRDIYRTRSWNLINKPEQTTLLNYFINAVDIVASIHKKGYVQRDISDSNFLVMPNGSLCIIDFELSCHIIRQEPAPPFPLGTIGYAPPEQLRLESPDYKEDIYGLGALLCFILTGIPPVHFITDSKKRLSADVHQLTHNSSITSMIVNCLSKHRAERPSLEKIRATVVKFMQV